MFKLQYIFNNIEYLDQPSDSVSIFNVQLRWTRHCKIYFTSKT